MWWHSWFPVQHWLAIHTGTDNEASGYYGAFSGWVSDLAEVTLIGGMVAVYRKHSCHTAWCIRFGHHDFTDEATGIVYRLCAHHHPQHPGRRLTKLHIARIHRANRGGHHEPQKPAA